MLELLNSILGGVTPIAVVLTGAIFAVILGGRPFSRPRGCLRALRGGGDGQNSPFRALMLALAGTLGVGNIVGVSSAIALGGAGAVFWMWISALFALLLKYAEVVLAMRCRKTLPDGTHRGGAPYYICRAIEGLGMPRLASVAAVLFALLCLVNSLLMGCVIQSNAAAQAMEMGFSLSPAVCGVVLAVLCLIFSLRGRRAVSAVTGILVPLMSAVFFALSIGALSVRRSDILPALGRIFKDAFSPLAAGGGLFGFLTSRALRFGTVRGIISNEAGCGTSPTAHAASDAKSPVEQGVFGMMEVFVDTLVLCTVTALVILIHGGTSTFGGDPMAMTLRAYAAAFGSSPAVVGLLSVCILCFGFATLICWSHYGAEALEFVVGTVCSRPFSTSSRPFLRSLFSVIFAVCTALGAISAPVLIWALTDLVTAAMTLINIPILLLSAREIQHETKQYFR